MARTKCLAMLLAGGQGSRLDPLTSSIAKPAVSFGGKYRIIDFALSNCSNSNINNVGVLTQYRPYLLHNYVGSGAAWNLDSRQGGVSLLPPYATQEGGSWYAGTADAIYQNLDFIEVNQPDYVLILSGDHLYSMNYQEMLRTHKKNNAALTIAVMPVSWDEASRFGIITKDENNAVVKFTEKPKEPDSNLASMGIYIFSRQVLVDALHEDAQDPNSEHDFGKNIIPALLEAGDSIYCHEFNGFWKDVGTIDSYYETSMMLLSKNPEFDLYHQTYPIFSNEPLCPPHRLGLAAKVSNSIVVNGCWVDGEVTNSIISTAAYVGNKAVVKDSILLPGARVERGAYVERAILGEKACVKTGAIFGSKDGEISVIGNHAVVEAENSLASSEKGGDR